MSVLLLQPLVLLVLQKTYTIKVAILRIKQIHNRPKYTTFTSTRVATDFICHYKLSTYDQVDYNFVYDVFSTSVDRISTMYLLVQYIKQQTANPNLDCSQSPIFPWDFRDSYEAYCCHLSLQLRRAQPGESDPQVYESHESRKSHEQQIPTQNAQDWGRVLTRLCLSYQHIFHSGVPFNFILI